MVELAGLGPAELCAACMDLASLKGSGVAWLESVGLGLAGF